MNDLTRGPVRRHLVRQALPIAIGMLVQTLYLLVDLYFVGRLGGAALAGVGAAGNLMFMVMALTQMLSVGMVALIAPALGRGDTAEARLLFNQGLSLAALGSLITLATGYAFASSYLQLLGAGHATRREGLAYLYAYLPGLALQFPLAALGAALRASGMTKPGMLVQLLTVLINTVLAPILITGAGTGLAMGVAGAGLASSVAIAAGALIVARYIFAPLGGHLRPERKAMRPQWPVWKTILGIGFPAGAEFACIFLLAALTYHALSRFGADAMAGFGIGTRIMQAIFLPGMAIAFAIPAIAGQNLGAGRLDRVGETMREALKLECGVMVMLTVLCKWQGGALVGTFTSGAGAAAVAREYLDVISWNFLAVGLVFACSGLFQAFGNAWPGLWSMVARLLLFAAPALWLPRQPDFTTMQLWHVSVLTGTVQAAMSLWLLRRQWRRKVLAESKLSDMQEKMHSA